MVLTLALALIQTLILTLTFTRFVRTEWVALLFREDHEEPHLAPVAAGGVAAARAAGGAVGGAGAAGGADGAAGAGAAGGAGGAAVAEEAKLSLLFRRHGDLRSYVVPVRPGASSNPSPKPKPNP